MVSANQASNNRPQEGRVNRADACLISHRTKQVIILEMSCPWIGKKEKKSDEMTLEVSTTEMGAKGMLRRIELQQYNIITDTLGGWSKDLHLDVQRMDTELRSRLLTSLLSYPTTL